MTLVPRLPPGQPSLDTSSCDSPTGDTGTFAKPEQAVSPCPPDSVLLGNWQEIVIAQVDIAVRVLVLGTANLELLQETASRLRHGGSDERVRLMVD